MFYVNKTKLLSRRDALFAHIIPSLIVFLSFAAISIFNWSSANTNSKKEVTKSLQQQNSAVVDGIQQRISTYEDMLRGGAGLFYASNEVTYQDWDNYFTPYAMKSRYPGIQGIGYAQVIQKKDIADHINKIRTEIKPDYNIYPQGDREFYTSVIYLNPITTANRGAIGFDMYSDPTRRAAMDMARDTGSTSMSNVVTLIKDQDSLSQNQGFLMYQPVYVNAESLDDISERRNKIIGYVYAPFRTYDLINKILPEKNDYYEFKVSNKTSDGNIQTVYQSPNFEKLTDDTSLPSNTSSITLPNTQWEVTGIVTPEILISEVRDRPTTSLWGGLLFSFLIAGFIYLLLGNRARVLADKEQKGVQEAKDELLALASHQLRTPATGVKQYIGMIREGFAGDVSPVQKELLDKAYASNERQLSTINEMLFVARADAGHLELRYKNIDIAKMLREIVDEQGMTFSSRKQKVTLKLPNKPIVIAADRQYIRMAYENIISNATKYTQRGGKIDITLRNYKNQVTCKIKDNGVGVSPKNQQLLFKKFSRIPNELTNQVSGSGIGLYLTRAIIKKHRGTISFESSEGKGSTVTICLPKRNIAKN